jgi:addiction module HigA family antidote
MTKAERMILDAATIDALRAVGEMATTKQPPRATVDARRRPNEYAPTVVSPPGATLLDLLEERGMTHVDLARRLGRPKKTINEIIRGKTALTADTAMQLEQALGTPASFWIAREARYREYLARLEHDAKLADEGAAQGAAGVSARHGHATRGAAVSRSITIPGLEALTRAREAAETGASKRMKR